MQLNLEAQSPVPLYQQIVDQIRRQISLGFVEAGAKLPTVRELAVQARVNRNTAARAIQNLEAMGLVYTRVGRGTFVADGARALCAQGVGGALDELLDRVIGEARDLGVDLSTLPKRLQERIDIVGEDKS